MTERRSGSPDGKEEKPDSTPSFLELEIEMRRKSLSLPRLLQGLFLHLGAQVLDLFADHASRSRRDLRFHLLLELLA